MRISVLIVTLAFVLTSCASDDTVELIDTSIDTSIDDTGDADGPCAGGGWGTIADPDGSVHVRPGGTALASGGKDDPVGTIAQALALIADGAPKVLALGPGTFDANLALTGPFEVHGCSADETTVRADDGSLATLTASTAVAQSLVVSGLTLDGGHRGAVLEAEGTIALRGVTITGASRAGVLASGLGEVVLEDVAVLDVEPDDVGFGWGVTMRGGGSLTVTGGRIEHANGYGLVVDHGVFDVDGLIIDSTEELLDGTFGRGVHVQDAGGSFTNVQISHSKDAGLFALRPLGVTAMGLIIDSTEEGFAGNGDGMVFSDGIDPIPSELRDGFLVTVQDSTITNSARLGMLLSGQILAILNNNEMSSNAGNGYNSYDVNCQEAATVQGTDLASSWQTDAGVALDLVNTDADAAGL